MDTLFNPIVYSRHYNWTPLFYGLTLRQLHSEFGCRYREYMKSLRMLRDENSSVRAYYSMTVSSDYMKMIACLHAIINY